MPVAWDYATVAFIDILGFASFVEQDAKSFTPQHLGQLLATLRDVKAAAPARNIDVRAFSDSLILTTGLESVSVVQLLESVLTLQRIFIGRNVLIRGAIAFGKHYADAELVYSQALVLAYRIERDHARFPRVLIDGNLLDWFLNDVGTTPALRGRFTRLLLRDRDSRVFLNYLEPRLLPVHLRLLQSYELNRVTASVLEKVQWLAEYHNHIARAADPAEMIRGPLLEGFQPI